MKFAVFDLDHTLLPVDSGENWSRWLVRAAGMDVALMDARIEAYAEAYRNGEVLKFIARLENGHARVGLEALPREHPLASGAGTDNRVAIWSDRYRDQPVVLQGPGAGAEVTAAALFDDLLAIVRETGIGTAAQLTPRRLAAVP